MELKRWSSNQKLEYWKSIENYEGLYMISDLGRVKSLNYSHTGKAKILQMRIDKWGYLQIGLYKDGKTKAFLVHRLVAIAFIPNPLNKPQVNHIDENKENNNVKNLEWVTNKENSNWGTKIERGAKSQRIPVIGVNIVTNEIIELEGIKKSKEFGFNPSSITNCCQGKQETHKGYKFYYKKNYEKMSKEQIEKDLEESKNSRKDEYKKLTGGNNPKARKVKCIETNQIFNTLTQACKWCGLKSVSNITLCCQGKTKYAGKHPVTNIPLHWEYVTEEQELEVNLNLFNIDNIKILL